EPGRRSAAKLLTRDGSRRILPSCRCYGVTRDYVRHRGIRNHRLGLALLPVVDHYVGVGLSCQKVTCRQILDQQNLVPLSSRLEHETIVMPGGASRAPLAPSARPLLPAKATMGMDLSIAFLVVLAFGFALGYGVRERKSRMRRRRYNLG